MLQTVKSLFRKKGLYTYLQYTQLLAKKSDLQPFSKSLFFCWWWFFQIRMSRSIKMRRKKRQLVSEDFLLETATGNRENGILEKSLLGTTSCSSCAVPRTVSAPLLHSAPAYSLIPLNSTLQTRGMKRGVNGDCFDAFELWAGSGESGRGVTDRDWQPACQILSNSEDHPPNPSRAVGCSNSSDTRALAMRFSSVWFLTETDCT